MSDSDFEVKQCDIVSDPELGLEIAKFVSDPGFEFVSDCVFGLREHMFVSDSGFRRRVGRNVSDPGLGGLSSLFERM